MGYMVYMHTNKTNGKKYIGVTSQKTASRRWHNGEGYKKQRRFYSAIRCYGWDGFEHTILESGLSKEEAESIEESLIKEFRSNEPNLGYNIENGGRTHKLSESQKNHLREINNGKKHTEETKKKMSESHKGLSPLWLTGRKATAETRKKMSASRCGINNARARAVLQLSADGVPLATYETMKKAAEAINAPQTSHISLCCNGKRKMAYGYMWSYVGVN